MFGKSYSEKAVNELGSLIKLLDELAEDELQEEPITGIPFNSEFQPITLFMSGEKKEKAKKRTIANGKVRTKTRTYASCRNKLGWSLGVPTKNTS